jgi:hypothetical protein
MTRYHFRAALVVAGLALVPFSSSAQTKEDFAAWVQKRVDAWQPTADERRIDQIAWAKDLRTAAKLAKEHGRPMFLFSYSGSAVRENAMALERC